MLGGLFDSVARLRHLRNDCCLALTDHGRENESLSKLDEGLTQLNLPDQVSKNTVGAPVHTSCLAVLCQGIKGFSHASMSDVLAFDKLDQKCDLRMEQSRFLLELGRIANLVVLDRSIRLRSFLCKNVALLGQTHLRLGPFVVMPM